jgi:hypothetical protein
VLLLREMDLDTRQALDFIERGERPTIDIAGNIGRYQSHFEELIQMLDARMRGVLKRLDESGGTFPESVIDVPRGLVAEWRSAPLEGETCAPITQNSRGNG